MRDIEVKVLSQAHINPDGMMAFLAKLTQRGHKINNMDDLIKMYDDEVYRNRTSTSVKQRMLDLPHGTIKRFTPITIAIVGASRRFLAQARTHQVGIDFLSASLQYSDYSSGADFVVPYELIEKDYYRAPNDEYKWIPGTTSAFYAQAYLDACAKSMNQYRALIDAGTNNDTAGYTVPQGLRNILIMQGNHQSWDYFIRLRSCNRNTNETQYVALRILEALQNETFSGELMFAKSGPDCRFGCCRENEFSCGNSDFDGTVSDIIKRKWPLLFSM